jgi:hypothetical protein
MSFEYDIVVKEQYVVVRARGAQISVDQCIEYANSIMEICTGEKCRLVLLDERELRNQMGIFDDFDLSNRLFSMAF